MINALLAQFWPYIAGVIAVLAAYFGVRQSGKSAALAEQAAQLNKQADAARKEASNVQDTVAKMGDDAVSSELKSGWVRDPGKGGG